MNNLIDCLKREVNEREMMMMMSLMSLQLIVLPNGYDQPLRRRSAPEP
jgi:hypothetical protein